MTGGAGFLGSCLCGELLGRGDEVLCVDNFYTGSRGNIGKYLGDSGFEFLRHDVTFPLYVEVDEIYNLACPASPLAYARDPVQTVKTCVHGAINMLGLAKRTGARILQASTSEVYGDPDESPQGEGYLGRVNQLGPRACYDEGKRCAETLFMAYSGRHDVETRIARIFNTYGPGMSVGDGRVVSAFILSALRGEPLWVYGDGKQTRCFCYVTDMVTGLIDLMGLGGFNLPVNLGSDVEIEIGALAEMIKDMTGSKSEIRYLPSRIDDPKQRKPRLDLAKKTLSWKPKVSLVEGLGQTILCFTLAGKTK